MRPSRSTLLALALTLPSLALADPRSALKLSPALTRALAEAPDGRAEMLVVLAEQADLSPARRLASKAERGAFVYERLTETARRTQPELLDELARLGAPARSFWAANFVWTTGDLALAERLAARADVARLDTNPRLVLAPPELDLTALDAPAAPGAIEWNLTWVNADDVWALGYTGQGAVIAGQDTGYQWDHPALKAKYRGWNGTSADHDYNWHDAIHSGGGVCGADAPAPCDDDSHGTHTMGTMVGDDGGANQIGMAPGAKWIGCRNMDQGVGTPTTYIECFQWFIAPTDVAGQNPDPGQAPDVINNSWGCPTSEGCNPGNFAVMQQVVENVRAAGIFVAVSAGNSGSSCSTVTDPAAIYDASFSVGATGDHTDAIASYSSRGPVTVDGSNRMKPDISAPGSNIRSSTPGSTYQGGWSGTSMAGPHVAGLVGLLISAVPSAAGDIDRLEDAIRQTAVHPSFAGACGDAAGVFPNNTFGAGRIDALAAVNLLLSQNGFAMSVTPPSRAVCAPADATYTVDLLQYGAFGETVSLVPTGHPAGSTAGFSVDPVTPPGSSLLTITTAGVAAGSSTITVTGTSNPSALVDSVSVGLSVFTAAPAAATLLAPADGAIDQPRGPALSWSAVPNTVDYTVEVATDAGFTNIVRTQSVAGTSWAVSPQLGIDTDYHWRVTANNACGSAVSGVFDFRTANPSILLVDDDDNGPDVRPTYDAMLGPLAVYDVWDTAGGEPTLTDLIPYRAVVWFTGDRFCSSTSPCTGPQTAAETALGQYLDAGRCLFIASQDYLWDMGGSGHNTATPFMASYLGLASATSDSGDYTRVDGANAYAAFPDQTLAYPYSDYSDILVLGSGAQEAFRGDTGSTNLGAISKLTANYFTTFSSFGLEALPSASRTPVLTQFMTVCDDQVPLFRDDFEIGSTNRWALTVQP